MVRRFVAQARRWLKSGIAKRHLTGARQVHGTIVTGILFHPILDSLIRELNERMGTHLKVVAVPSRFFGQEVTVAGLLAGSDILAAREAFEGDFIVVPEQACLKSGEVFLDDLCLTDLERSLGLPVINGGPSFPSMAERVLAPA